MQWILRALALPFWFADKVFTPIVGKAVEFAHDQLTEAVEWWGK